MMPILREIYVPAKFPLFDMLGQPLSLASSPLNTATMPMNGVEPSCRTRARSASTDGPATRVMSRSPE